jgi:hypothetical protein
VFSELLVQAGLGGDGVVAEDQGVGVAAEGHGRVTELADAVVRVESSGEPILTTSGPKPPMLLMT